MDDVGCVGEHRIRTLACPLGDRLFPVPFAWILLDSQFNLGRFVFSSFLVRFWLVWSVFSSYLVWFVCLVLLSVRAIRGGRSFWFVISVGS